MSRSPSDFFSPSSIPCLVYQSRSSDPAVNLALEKSLRKNKSQTAILFLWKNDPSLIIGRLQNAWTQTHVKIITDEGIPLLRRESGGGAVFHDQGCALWSLIAPQTFFNQEQGFKWIHETLKSCEVSAHREGRNDVIVETKEGHQKVSGSAFLCEDGTFLHHGTLLIDTDLQRLGRYLTPPQHKWKSKGINSQQKRVTTLKKLYPHVTVDLFFSQAEQEFIRMFCPTKIPQKNWIDEKTLQEFPQGLLYLEQFRSRSWNWGENPPLHHRLHLIFEREEFQLELSVKEEFIDRVVLQSDTLYPQQGLLLEKLLRGCSYQKKAMIDTLKDYRKNQVFSTQECSFLHSWELLFEKELA